LTVVWVSALLAVGCGAAPHPYRYRPPIPVATADWEACHADADAVAQQRYDRYMDMVEAVDPFGGPFGGVTLGRRAWEEREDVYEWEMLACLGGRGYEVRTPAGAPGAR